MKKLVPFSAICIIAFLSLSFSLHFSTDNLSVSNAVAVVTTSSDMQEVKVSQSGQLRAGEQLEISLSGLEIDNSQTNLEFTFENLRTKEKFSSTEYRLTDGGQITIKTGYFPNKTQQGQSIGLVYAFSNPFTAPQKLTVNSNPFELKITD